MLICIFRICTTKTGGKNTFDPKDLEAIFKFVGYEFRKMTEYGVNEAEDIVWEHDEDLNVLASSHINIDDSELIMNAEY